MRYVIYCMGRRPTDEHVRHFVPIFEDPAIAKAFIAQFMGNEPMIPQKDKLFWGDGFTIRAPKMDDILTADDAGTLPIFYERQILQFKYSAWDAPPKAKEPVSDDGTTPAPSSVRITRAARPAGYVTITELATTWGIPALHARAALRASNRTKPEYGWAFDPKDVDAIKKICMVGAPA